MESHRIVAEALRDLCVCPSGCVAIHGIVYDARAFATIHPGGEVWLRACSGQDVTVLFESSHVNHDVARRALDRLPRKGTCGEDRSRQYESYRRLRNEAQRIFPTRESRAMSTTGTLSLVLWTGVAFVLHACVLRVAAWSATWLVACLASSFVNSVCGGFGHNALHRLHPYALALDWNGLSSFEWVFEHVVSHHPHVNSAKDHDSLSMEPFLRWLPDRSPAWLGDAQSSFAKHLIYLIAEPAVAFQGFFGHRLRWKAHMYGAPWWMVGGPWIFLMRTASVVAAHGIFEGVATLFVTLAMAGYFFAYLAHESHKVVRSSVGSDFVAVQTANTEDLHTKAGSLVLFLDRQVAHHLFPTIDHTQLPRLSKNFRLENI